MVEALLAYEWVPGDICDSSKEIFPVIPLGEDKF